MKNITSNSAPETKKIGLKLAKILKKGDSLALIGDLGSGKTTFLQGLAKGLGVKNRIISPTFVQLKIYPLTKFRKGYLYHFDFYRSPSFSQVQAKGLKEYLQSKNGIVVIEWADKILKWLPTRARIIKFSHVDKKTRRISLP